MDDREQMRQSVDVGEFAETVASMLRGEFGDRHAQLHGWEIVGLDIGEVEIRTRTLGNFRLTVQPLTEDD